MFVFVTLLIKGIYFFTYLPKTSLIFNVNDTNKSQAKRQ